MDNTTIFAGLGIGAALAGAPGPVQAVIVSEALRAGLGRGLQAVAGASLTFGALLLALALGVSLVAPDAPTLRLLSAVGGAFLLWLAWDGLRSSRAAGSASGERHTLPPVARGSLAVLLNPGAWLFLAAVASPLLAGASERAGTGAAALTALALMGGAALGDAGMVVLAAAGLRRARASIGIWVQRLLAVTLAVLGIGLLATAVIG